MYKDDTNLPFLISLLSEERDRLTKLIDQAISDNEYLSAHYHAEALEQVSSSLYKLRELEEPLHNEKAFWKRNIARIESDIASEPSSEMREYFQSELISAREELEKLNRIVEEPTQKDKRLFADILEQLLDKKVKHLKLILIKNDNFYFSISYANNTAKLNLPGIKQLLNKKILYYDNLKDLEQIGFVFTLKETKLTLTIQWNKEEILKKLNHTFAKIVFDVFRYIEFKADAYLQFIDKTKAL
ncbi:hypothetical protein [Sphingobacterium sp.]|uniref:hypothetical protein n=1 Tax=Sphingobacterium sp. TaxID=341027 RepID=UPI00289A8AC1|nr:hypothetical protein [Sphingobacterium sp.]